MEKHYQKAHWTFLCIAFFALILPFFVEYVIGIRPCILCKLQRIPYFATGVLALLGLFVSFKRSLFRLIQVCFLAGIILATYHSSIQFGFLRSPCQKKKIKQTGPSWRLFGFPLPLYNGIFSLTVLIGTEVFLIHTRKKD